jgi:UDP-3-O-[3-hydroxymyristoyl] N-acetylglucosamine deacetylase/UDP-3-O-[3-hydroxymyristoyl] N-acetylglucosamine deacetylase/3-hydroxyacyl-[acyl-carrier-protein] dehydratase
MRQQRTLAREAVIRGIGLFRGADVTVRLLPADEGHGIQFQRVDLAGDVRIPALIEHVVLETRRTALAHQGATVETIEHLMATLAGLQVDNCLVQMDSPEPPVGDGSAVHFVDAVMDAGIVEQTVPRPLLTIHNKVHVFSLDRRSEVAAGPSTTGAYSISYQLEYPHPALAAQRVSVDITPQAFLDAVAFARTFVLADEVAALQSQGYGRRMTTRNLLIIGPDGPLENAFHTPDECARHKLLDCIGDLALIGCDLCGCVRARRSGHRHNHELARDLLLAHPRLHSPSRSHPFEVPRSPTLAVPAA